MAMRSLFCFRDLRATIISVVGLMIVLSLVRMVGVGQGRPAPTIDCSACPGLDGGGGGRRMGLASNKRPTGSVMSAFCPEPPRPQRMYLMRLGVDVELPRLSVETLGVPGACGYSVHLVNDEENPRRISFWHDIPVRSGDEFTFVCEIPAGTREKYEINKWAARNAIMQDIKHDHLRLYYEPIPWNYGAIPQTYESPQHRFAQTDAFGDGDPIDVVEIGMRPMSVGMLATVRILGALALLDEEASDWKIIAIDVTDPLARKYRDIRDVPSATLDAIRTWFREYKIPEGKPPNRFAMDGRVLDAAAARTVVMETHRMWRELLFGTRVGLIRPDYPLNDAYTVNRPYGGILRDVDFAALASEIAARRKRSVELPSLALNDRQLYDLELLMVGAFSPLETFMGRADYERCVRDMRLSEPSALLWPIPITLDVSEEFAATLTAGSEITLRDRHWNPLALYSVTETWRPDRELEARLVYNTTSTDHPAVAYLLQASGPVYVAGQLRPIELPQHSDFVDLRRSPRELRAWFSVHGWRRIVAFQTRNPMHRAHIELTRRAAAELGAWLLLQPVVGPTKADDIDYVVRVRSYRALLESNKYWPADRVVLSLLPLAMRMGGPREVLLHAIVRKNYGCTDLIVGRDHAGPKDRSGRSFYKADAAQIMMQKHAASIGIGVYTSDALNYVPWDDAYHTPAEIVVLRLAEPTAPIEVRAISGTEVRRRLNQGRALPEWFTDPAVLRILREAFPPLWERGICFWFIGRSGSGKTTLARALVAQLQETVARPVTFLDGDVVRRHLSAGLTLSREDRETNIERIAFVAGEVVRNRGIAVVAAITPYESSRARARETVQAASGLFYLIYVDTPEEVCAQRDTKGLYAQVHAGKTSMPFETPAAPDVTLSTTGVRTADAIAQLMARLLADGVFAPDLAARLRSARATGADQTVLAVRPP